MKQRIKLGILGLCLFLSGCQVQMKTANTEKFISYTQTKEVDDKLISGVYKYDFNQKPELIYQFEYDSGYPLGVVDNKIENVYYTRNNANNKMEIVQHNLKHNTDEIISTRTSAVNYIVPIKNNKLFIVSYDLEDNKPILYPFIYDVSEKKLEKIELNPLLSIRDVKYDSTKNVMYFSAWEWEQEKTIIESEAGYNQVLQRNIYQFNLENNQLKKVYEAAKENEYEYFGVDLIKNQLYIPTQKEKDTDELSVYDMANNKVTETIQLPVYNDIVYIDNENKYYISEGRLIVANGKEEKVISDNIANSSVNNAIVVERK